MNFVYTWILYSTVLLAIKLSQSCCLWTLYLKYHKELKWTIMNLMFTFLLCFLSLEKWKNASFTYFYKTWPMENTLKAVFFNFLWSVLTWWTCELVKWQTEVQAVLGSGKAKSSTVARARGNPVWTITVLLKDNPALNWSNIPWICGKQTAGCSWMHGL